MPRLQPAGCTRRRAAPLAAVAAPVVAALALAPSSQAKPPSTFSLACKLTASQVAHVDLAGVTASSGRFDATRVRYRSLAGNGASAASFRPDLVRLELRDQRSALAIWTSQGGALHDGVTVPPVLTWDPPALLRAGSAWTGIRLHTWLPTGQSCISPWKVF